MDKNYSTRDYFRQMPNALLARYFQGRDIFGDLDFTTMKEGNRDELFAAWLVLPVEKRNTMDAEFMDIFNMSCQKGFLAIIDEASHHFKDIARRNRALFAFTLLTGARDSAIASMRLPPVK